MESETIALAEAKATRNGKIMNLINVVRFYRWFKGKSSCVGVSFY